jgi:uncharacterized protein YndB with AHSA1/START domain
MKTLILTLLATIALPSLACTFTSTETPDLLKVIDEKGGYRVSEAQCLLMKRKKLSLLVSGAGIAFKDVAVGWSEVRLVDSSTGVTSSRFHNSTHVHTELSNQEIAKSMLYGAVTDAIAGLDFEAAVAEIEALQPKQKSAK